MSLTYKAEKLKGSADSNFTTGVFSKHIAFEEGGSGLFVFCALVKLKDDEASVSAGSVLNETFESECKKIADHRDDIYESLLAMRTGGEERFAHLGLEVSFAVAFFYKDVVYVAKSGEHIKMGIVRPPKTFEVDFLEGSGRLRGDDLVLISTSKFAQTFDWNVFATDEAIVFADAIDGLATDISALEGQSEVGAVFVQVKGAGAETDRVKHIEIEPKAEVEQIEQADVSESSQVFVDEQVLPEKKKSIIGGLGSALVEELKRLKVGDIRAIFRLRRNLVLVAILLVLALAGSGFMTIQGEKDAKRKVEFESYMVGANSKYSEAVGIVDLNRERARELLVEAEREVDMALAVFPNDARSLELKRQIEEKLAQTANLSSVDFSTFYDNSDKIGAFSRGVDSFFVFGDAGIVEVDEDGREIDTLSEDNVIGGFVYDNNVFSVLDGKVFKITDAGKSVEIARNSSLRDMAVFLGNVYVLGSDQIYKYVPIADGYAKSVDYLEQTKSFGAESRMAIDGSVWVTVGSEIFKYTRGAAEAFEISGVGGVGTLGEIYTNSDIDNLYVVDRSNSALLVVSKEGVVSKTYNSSEFVKATDLFVDEPGGKMYIGTGTKVLVADL